MVQAAVDSRAARRLSSVMPSLEAWRRFSPAMGVDLGLGGQAGYMFSSVEGASGTYVRSYAFAAAPVAPALTATARLSVERLSARNGYYSHVTPKVEAGLVWRPGDWSLAPRIEVSRAFYDGVDGFWGVRRTDLTVRPSVTVSNAAVAWRDFVPEVTAFYEKRDSNVFIHSYSQFGGYLNFRKRF